MTDQVLWIDSFMVVKQGEDYIVLEAQQTVPDSSDGEHTPPYPVAKLALTKAHGLKLVKMIAKACKPPKQPTNKKGKV